MGSSVKPTWLDTSKTLRAGRLPAGYRLPKLPEPWGGKGSRQTSRESEAQGPTPKASEGQAGKAKDGDRPGDPPIWRESWKTAPF